MVPITLKRRFLVQNLLLVGGILLAGSISVWRLVSLSQQINISQSIYSELRTVGHVAVDVGTAEGLLIQPEASREGLINHLNYAIGGLDQFIRVSQGYGESGDRTIKDAYVPINRSAASAQKKLQQVLDRLRGSAPVTNDEAVKLRASVDSALGDVDQAASSCIRFIAGRQQTASTETAKNLLLIGVLSAAAVLAAVLLSISQYHLIMTPLQRLRRGVRKMAEVQFAHTLDKSAMGKSPEFVDLASEFNRMSAELNEFYRRLEEQVRSKSRELVRSERLASVGFLAAGVAHEINNPLNIISGYAELISRRLEPDRDSLDGESTIQMRENLRIIREEAFRCKEITDKLLSLSRNGGDTREELDLALVARDVATMTKGLKNYRDRRLTLKLDPAQPLAVRANMTEMKQVLLNLTINALESVVPIDGEVCIEGRQQNGWVELCVADNGRGMCAEVLSHVFEPFFTARKSNAERGTGLGLSITHAIVESHNGRIEAQSEGPGRGARFTVRFPAWARREVAGVPA